MLNLGIRKWVFGCLNYAVIFFLSNMQSMFKLFEMCLMGGLMVLEIEEEEEEIMYLGKKYVTLFVIIKKLINLRKRLQKLSEDEVQLTESL